MHHRPGYEKRGNLCLMSSNVPSCVVIDMAGPVNSTYDHGKAGSGFY